MDLPDSRRREILDKLKGVFARLHGGEFNPYRMQVMLDKARATREMAEAPRRTEHFGGVFRYPPIEGSPPQEQGQEPVPKEEPKVARWNPGFRTTWDPKDIDRMRRAWVARLAGQRSK